MSAHCTSLTNLLVFDPLQLPLDDHLSQVYSQFPLLYGHTGGEAKTLHCTDHVLHQVMAHRIVHLVGETSDFFFKVILREIMNIKNR